MRPLAVILHRISGEHAAQVPFSEDRHSVGDLGADGQDEAFGEAVRPRAPGWDLDHLDTRIGHHRVEGSRELSGPIADQESEPPDVLAEVHDEVAACWVVQGPSGCAVTPRMGR